MKAPISRLKFMLALCLMATALVIGCLPGKANRTPTAAVFRINSDEVACAPEPRPAQHIVAFSGGGMYGAYSAGVLSGWTDTGARPEFDVVTGISTGALIGTCAFIGPSYDAAARRFYTTINSSDVYSYRFWITILFSPSAASNKPLKQNIDLEASDEVLALVAAGHKAGRRLYVGTTNLETHRLTIWDMGAIACQNTQESKDVFRSILLASCAVPGMLPPIKIEVIRDGKRCTEWHVDGGVTAPFFIPEQFLTPENNQKAGGTNLYVVLAGKYFAENTPVKPRVLRVLESSATAVVYAHSRSELNHYANKCKVVGARYHATALDEKFPTSGNAVAFEPAELTKLFAEGYRQGAGGPVWDVLPPSEGPNQR